MVPGRAFGEVAGVGLPGLGPLKVHSLGSPCWMISAKSMNSNGSSMASGCKRRTADRGDLAMAMAEAEAEAMGDAHELVVGAAARVAEGEVEGGHEEEV